MRRELMLRAISAMSHMDFAAMEHVVLLAEQLAEVCPAADQPESEEASVDVTVQNLSRFVRDRSPIALAI